MKKSLLILLLPFVFTACVTATRPPPTQLSQVQTRQLQTRQYQNITVLDAMKAVSAVLQDEGYTIDSSNTELGLITGSREISDVDTGTRDAQLFWVGIAKDYRSARKWKATTNIQEIGKNVIRIRISLLEQELNEGGGVIYSQPVVEGKIYQTIFSKMDKSVFLQKNKL